MEEPHEVPAVLERLEEGLEETLFAVLLVGEEEEELILAAHRLPRGATPGSWLRLEMHDGQVLSITLDEATTTARRERIQAKREALRNRRRRFTPRS